VACAVARRLSALLAAALLPAMVWGTGLSGEERTAPWELRVAPRGLSAARAVDLETIENVIVIARRSVV
jgi:hypothetical protein